MKTKVAIIFLFLFGFFGVGAGECWAGFPCDKNGVCEWPESCNTCGDCHSCDIESYTGQREKYIDQTCQYNGNGLSDTCAASNGTPGRFNELQAAINSLAAGDTLYVYPGDYYHDRQSYGNYELSLANSGTAERPVVITAYDQNNPPVLYSLNPAGGSITSSPALLTNPDDSVHHVIFDHLKIDGLVSIHGSSNILQNIECTRGGGSCDGNWSCLRIEWCTDCVAHHNYIHDVDDAGFCAEGTSRPAGLKEFSSIRAIWEFNTVRNALQWGFDLHRSSTDPTIRYNRFENSGWATSIRFARSGDNSIYGNTAVGLGNCISGLELGSSSVGLHNDLIDHNTCVFPSLGIITSSGEYPTSITNNIISNASSNRTEGGNLSIAGTGHTIDYNAWDANGYYHRGLYVEQDFESLSFWQGATSFDGYSHESAGGYCQFVDAPENATDFSYDLHTAGNCLAFSSTGRQVGAYGITDCVGHLCSIESSTDTTAPSPPGGLSVL